MKLKNGCREVFFTGWVRMCVHVCVCARACVQVRACLTHFMVLLTTQIEYVYPTRLQQVLLAHLCRVHHNLRNSLRAYVCVYV